MREAMLEGARLFNAGAYWEAHEAWEIPWNAARARGDTRQARVAGRGAAGAPDVGQVVHRDVRPAGLG